MKRLCDGENDENKVQNNICPLSYSFREKKIRMIHIIMTGELKLILIKEKSSNKFLNFKLIYPCVQ